MNQPASTATDPIHPTAAVLGPVAPLDEDVVDAVRLPGLLGRPREALPVAPAAPPVPTALSTFNRLTGRLDQRPPDHSGADGAVVAELTGTPADGVRTAAVRS